MQAQLLAGPAATLQNPEASVVERSRAIRRLGSEGFFIGADALIEIVRTGSAELVAEAIWALEGISGFSYGNDVGAWSTWRETVAAPLLVNRTTVREQVDGSAQ